MAEQTSACPDADRDPSPTPPPPAHPNPPEVPHRGLLPPIRTEARPAQESPGSVEALQTSPSVRPHRRAPPLASRFFGARPLPSPHPLTCTRTWRGACAEPRCRAGRTHGRALTRPFGLRVQDRRPRARRNCRP